MLAVHGHAVVQEAFLPAVRECGDADDGEQDNIHGTRRGSVT